MSRFAEAMGGGLDAIYEAFGKPAFIETADGYRIDCTAIVERDLSQYGDVADVSAATAVLSIRVVDVPEKPRRKDVITLTESCEKFRIDNVILSDEFEHRFLAA